MNYKFSWNLISSMFSNKLCLSFSFHFFYCRLSFSLFYVCFFFVWVEIIVRVIFLFEIRFNFFIRFLRTLNTFGDWLFLRWMENWMVFFVFLCNSANFLIFHLWIFLRSFEIFNLDTALFNGLNWLTWVWNEYLKVFIVSTQDFVMNLFLITAS